MIIGNLGANAEVVEVNGSRFVTFRVAVTEKIKKGETTETRTIWYSCSYNRAESPVVNYLRTGQMVFVQGRPEFRIYDSAVHHCKMVDPRIYVDILQLCGSPEKKDQGEDTPTF